MALKQDIGSPCLECNDRCKGFQLHGWRKTCTACNCSYDTHDVFDDNISCVLDEMKLSDKNFYQKYIDAQKQGKASGLNWLPIGLKPNEVESFLSSLPASANPHGVGDDDKSRLRRLRKQIPVQDRRLDKFSHLDTNVERQEAEKFLKNRNSHDLSIGHVEAITEFQGVQCFECKTTIGKSELSVRIDHNESGANFWHPACFNCFECKELLVDYIYCWHLNKLYCARHYGEKIRPRCATCDELIFNEEYTRAMDQEHHPNHFACKNCDNSLTGHRYILKEENPHCIKCYETKFANTCEQCKEKIGCDSKDLSFKDRHWHEKCFECFECHTSLVDRPFATKDESLFCSECYDNKFAARCDGCTKVFKAGMRKYEYRGKQWHEECFLCLECKQPIGAKSFIPRDQQIICVPCYENKYAQKCSKCTEVIRRGGVTYKGTPWHKECFTCTNCTKQLAGIKFTSKDDKPYCADCYGELFAKKCTKCTKPITGFGGCKFISFEGRHWHSECFTCSKCTTNLVGRGFLTNEDNIMCPDCGR